jgi:hypothetical protein
MLYRHDVIVKPHVFAKVLWKKYDEGNGSVRERETQSFGIVLGSIQSLPASAIALPTR